jgi:hypothetical protein
MDWFETLNWTWYWDYAYWDPTELVYKPTPPNDWQINTSGLDWVHQDSYEITYDTCSPNIPLNVELLHETYLFEGNSENWAHYCYAEIIVTIQPATQPIMCSTDNAVS